MAQQSLGSITGSVSDTSRAVVQNADVTILNPDTGLKRSARTNSSGLYNFEDLPIRTYTVTIWQGGFENEEFTNIIVQANRTATVSTRLKAGSAETTVEATGTPAPQ